MTSTQSPNHFLSQIHYIHCLNNAIFIFFCFPFLRISGRNPAAAKKIKKKEKKRKKKIEDGRKFIYV